MNFNFLKLCLLGLFFLLIQSCGSKEDGNTLENNSEPTLFTLLRPEETGISFVNKVANSKEFNIFKYRNFYNGGGVAIGDINNDGLSDVFLTGNMEPNKLFLNKGDLKFEDISEKAGVKGNKPWSTGVVMADINNDGYLDIYVSNAGNMEGNNHDNDLYINNGDGTFTEKAHEYNLAETGFSTHASFFDYDKDGDLDAYILNNSNIPVSSLGYAEQREVRAQDWEGVPKIFRGVGDMLLRNDNGKFVDVSEDAGIYGSLIGFGLGVMVVDINNDLYPDIYVSNDFYERDYLYINNQDGTFSEEIQKWTNHLSLSAMGIDMADINNDGLTDIFITDMLPEPDQRVKSVMEFEGYNIFKLKQSKDFHQQYIQNTLQLNNGNGSFSEIAYYSGVEATDWSWSGLMFDMDNDGLKEGETLTFTGDNSITTTVSNNEITISIANDVVSGSAQLAADISGSGNVRFEALNAATSSYATKLGLGIVSASVLSSPSQGTARLAINGVNTDVDLGLQAGDSPAFTNLTVNGDLTVTGNTFEAQVTNLNVEDRMILLNSGSTSGDVGIIFGGSDPAGDGTNNANTGSGIFWDSPTNVFGFAQDVITSAVSASVQSKIGNIETSNSNPSATPVFQGTGTTHVNESDESIWIYS